MSGRRALLAAAALAPFAAQAREAVDGVGRRVALPERIGRVFPAGPPAAVLVHALAPEMLLGWTRAMRPAEALFLPDATARLPELGRLAGRGSTVNLEALLAARPDLVLDVGSTGPTWASLMDRVQEQARVPALLLDGALARSAALLREAGAILGVPERAAPLAELAAEIIEGVPARLRAAGAKPPSVYFARGPRGLQTALEGSINAEVPALLGARNVAPGIAGGGNLANVSMEQVLAWDPDAILTIEPAFPAFARADPLWRATRAVRQGRVHVSPELPFTWVDSPPGLNRLLGVRWASEVLFPRVVAQDLAAETARFHRLFYHREPSAAQLAQLLEGALARG
jgi:iron complex transport system substrate-binding protein